MTDKPPVHISYEDKAHKGRFVARINGVADEGELTIFRASDVLIIADGTFIPETLRGTGTRIGACPSNDCECSR